MSMRYPGGLIATTPVNQQFPSGVWTGPQSAPYQANNVWGNDSSFKNTTLLLHGDGATTPFIKDASTNNFQITLNGDTKPNNLTPFITNGYWSNAFDGSTSYFNIASNAAFGFGTGDFTVEFFIYPNVTANTWSIYHGTTTNSFIINTTSSGNLVIRQYGVTDLFTSASALTVGIWNHVAVSRSGTTISLWLNGSRSSGVTGTNSTNFATTGVYIGRADTATAIVNGWMSNVRTVKGTAVYDPTQTSITVPTSPLTAISGTSLLTCQSNRFIDNSSNAFSLTVNGSPSVSMQQPFTAPSGTSLYGSGYFDGSGDYLRVPSGYLTGVTTGDFTVEGWWNFGDFTTRTTYFQRLWSFGTGLANDVTLNVSNSGNLVFRINDSIIASQSSGAMSLNSWNHVALVRSSGTVTIYLNGTSVASAANSSNISGQASNSFYLGSESDGAGGYFYGYCSNVRITNTAVYTTTFTPSTTPLAPVSGTSLLTLQTNGPATNNGFLDSSYNSAPIARNGNVAQGSFNPYQTTGYWSNYFDGSGDYLTIPSSSTFSFTGSFTWEAWVYLPVTTSGAEIVSKHVSGVTGWYMLAINSSLNVNFVIWDGSNNSSNATTSGAVTLGAWNHIAGGRNGSTVFACLNGVYTSSALTVTPRTSDAVVTIGINANGSASPFNGYISNLRAVSAAVYTGNYTVPTAPLTAIASTQLLTCQSNRFKDNSSNAVALTSTGNTSVQIYQPFTLPALQYTPRVFGGSAYFDGSGDYLTLPANTGLLGSNDFSLEAWVYPFSSGNQVLINGQTDHNTAAGSSYSFNINQTPAVFIGGSAYTLNGAYPQVYAWSHVVFCRTGGTLSTFLNGVRVSTRSDLGTGAVNNGSTSYPPAIGANGSFDLYTGYICDARKIIGSGGYNATLSTLTVPTAPLTVTATTNMLVSMTNAAIFDNSGMNDLETVGNAKISTSVVKYGTSSMYFDGSGDYLLLQGGQNFTFGTGNFTIEMWIYVVSGLNADIVYYDGRPTSTNGLYNIIYTNSTGKLVYNTNSADRITGTTTLSTGIWYHIALSRSGTNTKLFLNGAQEGSPYTDSNSYIVGANRPVIAGNGYTLGNAPLNGYIDDLRITKGVARYVGNFTPPVARMPNQ